ncbi:MAG: hypothetical protein OEN22_07895 [Gammaproteobacteria bacterium]|nr:hypothetical protein [Gammaproteobacteria bacterium]
MKDPSSQNSTRPRQTSRRSLGKRVGDGARALGEFGSDIVNRPGVLPGKAHGWFRRWFAKIWRVRGGGLYAVGYALTFAYFEITTIGSELAESESIADFFTAQLLEFVLRFATDSFVNLVKAFMWPVYIVELAPPYGAIGLGLAFVAFPMFLKKPIERWLFGEETGDTDTSS